MRLSKTLDLDRQQKILKKDMLNVLVLKALFHKECGLLTFVFAATLEWKKHTFNTFLLLLL
jgi:hypothetical protein